MLKKGMVCGQALMEILILVSGRTLKQMDMGCIFGRMEIDMRVNGKRA